ncbi:hypothetical protein ACH4Y0_28370 [Streptomyces sp. NPDC020707]|uniref:Uncharacterized protein n=1 Tax=Streptomyces ortus TaxID=2867268 RepID=A0ABT3V4A3_9ACTN|nr:hypothetical protein [Streptomyces ortus]MCX4234580.1 hypothetical protein [Streptomyces ortus]
MQQVLSLHPGSYCFFVFSRWMTVGNVHERPLEQIFSGVAMRAARAELETVFPDTATSDRPTCLPECNPSFETCAPQTVCAPDAACTPTSDGGLLNRPLPSPHQSVRYHNPGVSGTRC